MRIRLDIAYDGTTYHGWGVQPGLPTVQGTIESALGTVFRASDSRPTLFVAGRTDAGVHATGQVAHFDIEREHFAHLLRPGTLKNTHLSAAHVGGLSRRLNGIIREDGGIVIRRVSEAPAGFDARFSALWRRYEYRLADAHSFHDPLQRARTTWMSRKLDHEAMDRAAQTLLGLRDFATYCKPRADATTVRQLLEFTWRRDEDGVLIAHVKADAFCHSMVRSLVGASVAVGLGDIAYDRPVELLEGATRSNEFSVMNARGLTLCEVAYPPDDELELRAQQTRATPRIAC